MRANASILVVEDEPQLRGLLRLYLEREGYRVTDAGDGPTARRLRCRAM
jgi:two-component system response regulator ResD